MESETWIFADKRFKPVKSFDKRHHYLSLLKETNLYFPTDYQKKENEELDKYSIYKVLVKFALRKQNKKGLFAGKIQNIINNKEFYMTKHDFSILKNEFFLLDYEEIEKMTPQKFETFTEEQTSAIQLYLKRKDGGRFKIEKTYKKNILSILFLDERHEDIIFHCKNTSRKRIYQLINKRYDDVCGCLVDCVQYKE